MNWLEKLSTISSELWNTAVLTAAETLYAAGSIACTVGGIGYAASSAMNETVDISYYGKVSGAGNIILGADINIGSYTYGENQTIPVSRSGHMDGGMTYELEKYIPAQTVATASVLCMSSGMVLRTLGANLKLWQTSREEHHYFRKTKGVIIPSPSWKEYRNVTASAVSGSFAFSLIGYGLTGTILDLTDFIGSDYRITYPEQGAQQVTSSFYSGPVGTKPFDIDYHYQKNVTYLDGTMILKEKVDAGGIVNATYGVGFFIKSHNKTGPSAIAPLALGFSADQAARFFNQKAQRQHAVRIAEAVPIVDYNLI